MKLIKIIFHTILLSFLTFGVFAQNQSLWSEITQTKADSVGLNALQYQVPLWGDESLFFNRSEIRDLNDGLYLHGWLTNDFNNDGFADIFLAFATQLEREPVPFLLLIYDKYSGTYKDQSFRIKNNIGQTYNRKSMSADFNGDGILDVVAVSHPECDTCRFSFVDVVLSNLDTTWTQKRIRTVDRTKCEGYHHGVAVGDINNDGYIDIVLANENNCIGGSISCINDGKGNFTENQAASKDRGEDFQTRAWTVELADINQDGCLDLFYCHDTLNTRILFGNCNGTFGDVFQDFVDLNSQQVLDYDIRDLDGDKDLDVVLTSTGKHPDWQFSFLENVGIDDSGRIIWINHSNEITNSLKSQGFYHRDYVIANVQLIDLNFDGFLDIINQQAPLSNSNLFSGWVLLGNADWNYTYKKLPFAEPPRNITSTFDSNQVNLTWQRVKQDFSESDGGINKWAIYISDKIWGDRSQVGTPIIVSSNDTKSENGYDQYLLEPTSREMFIRISPIDSTGIEWPLSEVHKITINPPAISSASICDGNNLTITGENLVGINKLTVGSTDVLSYSVISDKTILATLNTGQTGTINLSNVAGNTIFSNVAFVTPSAQTLVVTGNKSPLTGDIETYSVPESSGVTFNWIFPDGWVQFSGGNSNTVTVKTGTTGGIIQVIPSAVCGTLKQIFFPVSAYSLIPDDNFQKVLRDLGIDNENKNDSILTASLTNVTTLNLESKNIKDLTGIQHFESLKRLDCSNNQLEVLDLSKNTQLEELSCSGNKLNSLDISKNDSLKALFCDGNKLTELNVTQNKVLNSLGCGANPLTSLNVSQNKELVLLSIYSSTISSIDLSQNSHLILFHCGFNKFTQLDISKNLELRELACDANQITKLDLSKNTKLIHVICNWNKLTSLNLKNGNNSILSEMYADGNPNLTCINVDNPSLSETYIDWHKDTTANYSDNCVSTGIEIPELNKWIVVKPNPSKGIFKIEGLPVNQKSNIIVYTIDGRLIRKQICNTDNETIDLRDQISGVYLLFVNNQVFKILKE